MFIRPLRVGVTGGIGSGKSLICKAFRALGIPVYDADERAKSLIISNVDVIRDIRDLFGSDAYLADGTLNRLLIAGKVFNNKDLLLRLNAIVHPAVNSDFDSWVGHFSEKPYVIKEAALLLESGSYKELDQIITVVAPEDVRIQRVAARDSHRSEEDIRKIIQNQSNDDQKIAVSSFVVYNNPEDLIIPQLLKIHEFLVNMA